MTDREPEPTTEAGRRHIEQSACDMRDILAIEAEARTLPLPDALIVHDSLVAYDAGRADALREAAERVRALTTASGTSYVHRAAVLAILDPEAS